ncbi:hypothetical protein VP01_339g3 [Puccinia sorghi]|uniref:Uncharacterized protein n=1 Tax=Puccinia sorghi TaxID=27349 RepID=A0A0L6UWK9_9BASI|nr:hypothetical protein VP01_339g3 [Puccinia sorghi]
MASSNHKQQQRSSPSHLALQISKGFQPLQEDNSTTTLKKASEHIREKFDISVTPEAIQKTLKTVNTTWKTVTQIPQKRNEASFITKQHDYMLNQVTNIGQKHFY